MSIPVSYTHLDLVNVIPADVRVETYVRGNNMKAILEAAEKVDRAFEAGGHAMGAQCEDVYKRQVQE